MCGQRVDDIKAASDLPPKRLQISGIAYCSAVSFVLNVAPLCGLLLFLCISSGKSLPMHKSDHLFTRSGPQSTTF